MDKEQLKLMKAMCDQMTLVERTKRYLENLNSEQNLVIGSFNRESVIIQPEDKDFIVQMFIEALESWQQQTDEQIKAM